MTPMGDNNLITDDTSDNNVITPMAGNDHPEHIQDCNVEQVLHEDRLTLPASVKVIIISSSLP